MPNYDEYASMWEGNSPNAAHAYERMKAAGQAPDNAWLERLFGRRAQQQLPPAPAPVPTDEGRFPPSPFGGQPQAPAAPKPASKISSAADIAKRVSSMIAAANEPPPVSPADFGLPPSEYQNTQGDPLAAAVNQYPAEEPPPARVPVDMRDEPARPSRTEVLASLLGGLGLGRAEGASPFGNNTFGGYKTPGTRYGGGLYGGKQFGASAPRDPGETGGYPSMESGYKESIFPPTSPEGRGYMVQEDEKMRAMQQLLKMAQMFERQGTGETGGTPGTENFQQNRTLWDLLKGGNKFGGTRHGGQTFGASAKTRLPYDTPYAEGGYTAGGFSDDNGPPDPDELPHMMGLPKQVVQNNPQQMMPVAPPAPVAPPQQSSGGGGGGGDNPLGTIMSLLPLFLREGGEVPGFMRGGYPELYNAPIRHFDSGGASYVEGEGDGRSDKIDARLSPKEYVVDAETMSMLGDGNPDHGAKKMDQFRANVRKHKGKALAKGKFSPNAKNPAEYLIGNPMGDGMRRLGKGK